MNYTTVPPPPTPEVRGCISNAGMGLRVRGGRGEQFEQILADGSKIESPSIFASGHRESVAIAPTCHPHPNRLKLFLKMC